MTSPLQQQSRSQPLASATSPQQQHERQLAAERECDEYRIGPVSVSVRGPLALRFPGSDFAEVSLPSLSADVLVIASLADTLTNGESSLGIPRRFVRDAEVERDTSVVTFTVAGVRSFGDSYVRMRPHHRDDADDGGVCSKLLWLITGRTAHTQPASELVAHAATALHALAVLKQERAAAGVAAAARGRDELRMRRRRALEEQWERAAESERRTTATRAQYQQQQPLSGGGGGGGARGVDDARAAYADQLNSILLSGALRSPMR